MTDAEAQSAPPPAPVEEKPQAERKVIGGSVKINILKICLCISLTSSLDIIVCFYSRALNS